MPDSINVTGLTVAGRIDAPDPKNGQIAIQKNLNMSAASSFSIDFNSVNQQQTIGVIRTLFMDNTSNPSEVVVAALGTGQRFTVPAYAEGYFPVISRLNAGIVLTTNGGATDVVGVTFFNYDIPAVVWYKYGAVNKDIAQRVQGSIAAGQDATGPASDGLLIAGVDDTGKVRRLRVNAAGQMGVDFNNITIGGVTEADGANVALGAKADALPPTADYGAYSLIAMVKRVAEHLRLQVIQSTSSNTKLDTVIANTKNAANATRTSVAAATATVNLLAANAGRMQATVYNDSTAIMYLGLGGVFITVNDFSLQILPGGYYEVPAYFTGQVRAIWATADGFARVTELS